MEKQLELGLDLGLTELQKKAEELNQKAKALKLKTQIDLQLEDKLMKKEISKLEKEIKARNSDIAKGIQSAQDKKEAKEKLAKEVAEARAVLANEEGIDVSNMSNENVLKKMEELNGSPRFPFKVFAPDRELTIEFENGKRYTLDEIHKSVLANYPDAFYLSNANPIYSTEHNAVIFEMTGSRKGC